MRTALFASLLVVIFGTSPVAFRGCGDDPPPDIPLPPPRPDGGIICVVDEDCRGGSACEDLRCLAGSCVLVSGDIDRDHDGEAAPPCGNDCDDGDRSVRPGVAETCNGRDDDCNGAIDDGAPATVTNRVVAGLDGYASIAALGGTFVVAVGNDARTVDRYGRVGAPFDVLGDRIVTRTETATAPDGRALIASIVDGAGTIAFAVVSPGTPPIVSAPMEITPGGLVQDLAVVAHRGSFAMAWTWQDTAGVPSIAVMADIASPDPALQFDPESDRASLASDGVALAFPERAGLGFVGPGGIRVTQVLDGSLLRHGLASGDGFVVALTVVPGIGARATHFDRVTGTGSGLPLLETPEFVSPTDETRVAAAGAQYLAVRAGFSELRLAHFDVEGAGPSIETMLPRTGPTPVSIAEIAGLVGVLGATPSSALSAGTDLVLIADCAPPPPP